MKTVLFKKKYNKVYIFKLPLTNISHIYCVISLPFIVKLNSKRQLSVSSHYVNSFSSNVFTSVKPSLTII